MRWGLLPSWVKDPRTFSLVINARAETLNDKPAFRNDFKKSLSTPANPCCKIEPRATSTKSTGAESSCRCNRKVSRSQRLARLRTTAPPTFLLTTTPRREAVPSGSRIQLAIRQPCTVRWPANRTRAKSRPCLIRKRRPNPRRAGEGVLTAGLSDRCQAFAAYAAAIA